MQIRRVILKGVRNFQDFDRSFEDSWSGRVPDSLLLIGPNGSGKTTLLNVIADLWQILAHCLRDDSTMPGIILPSSSLDFGQRVASNLPAQKPFRDAGGIIRGFEQLGNIPKLPNNSLQRPKSSQHDQLLVISLSKVQSSTAAIELIGLEREPVWVIYGGVEVEEEDGEYGYRTRVKRITVGQIDSHRIGALRHSGVLFYQGGEPPKELDYWYANPGAIEPIEGERFLDWKQPWSERLIENVFGKRQDLPNIVYLESETRVILPVSEKLSVQPEPEEFRWLARYEPTTSRKGSLQNYLHNLKVVDEAAFESIVGEANKFLIGKRFNGFDRRTSDLMVEVNSGGRHPITDLSSGEKQVLLMLATITRWLRTGGVVLIDEPDLHLHSSLTTAFVGHLRRMVADKKGQLIIASHAPELLQDFTTSHRVELGSLSEVVR